MNEETQAYNEWAARVNDGDAARQTAKLAAANGQLTLFQNFSIRRIWHDGEWCYSLVDIMVPLTRTNRPRKYWADLKKNLLQKEGIEVSAIGGHLHHLPDARGRNQPTDCGNAETVLRVIQSIMSPHANDFKAWLARVGRIQMDDAQERTARREHMAKLDQYDREMHAIAEAHGVAGRSEHEQLADACWGGLYNVADEWAVLRMRPGTLPHDLPSRMGSTELAMNAFQRAMTGDLTERHALTGVDAVSATAREVGHEIRAMVTRMGGTLPEDLPQYPPLPPGEWMPDDHPSRIDWDEDAIEEASPIPLIEIHKGK